MAGANNRGASNISGPSTLGNISTVQSGMPGGTTPGIMPHGATGGTSGSPAGYTPAAAPTPATDPFGSGANAGDKTTVGDGTKQPIVTSGKGVGSDTPYRRKNIRKLGETSGNIPA